MENQREHSDVVQEIEHPLAFQNEAQSSSLVKFIEPKQILPKIVDLPKVTKHRQLAPLPDMDSYKAQLNDIIIPLPKRKSSQSWCYRNEDVTLKKSENYKATHKTTPSLRNQVSLPVDFNMARSDPDTVTFTEDRRVSLLPDVILPERIEEKKLDEDSQDAASTQATHRSSLANRDRFMSVLSDYIPTVIRRISSAPDSLMDYNSTDKKLVDEQILLQHGSSSSDKDSQFVADYKFTVPTTSSDINEKYKLSSPEIGHFQMSRRISSSLPNLTTSLVEIMSLTESTQSIETSPYGQVQEMLPLTLRHKKKTSNNFSAASYPELTLVCESIGVTERILTDKHEQKAPTAYIDTTVGTQPQINVDYNINKDRKMSLLPDITFTNRNRRLSSVSNDTDVSG